ncbi:replication restart helicase PriA [Olivibacter sitiensis]|uniref:replication restart helicase PriA n=1 Tax=Olivibacter sitiensis TaxID=376470 RepID=UPI00041B2D34|nr:primosomal protein N' [Olivibacter sitiensis]
MLDLQSADKYQHRKTRFVEVILPLSISKTYTYRVPKDLEDAVQKGKRVVVQFGRAKIYSAIVHHITEEAPRLYEAKYILDVLDDQPIVNENQIVLWQWIADYYLCHLGEVMQAALPAALKLASETKISATGREEIERSELNDKEFLVMDALDVAGELKVSDVTKLLGQKTVFPLIKRLLSLGFIRVSEELQERYKPRKKTFLKLNAVYDDPENRKALFEQLNRAPKQLDALLAYVQLARKGAEITKNDLQEASGCGDSAIRSLIDKEIFVAEEKVVSRLAEVDGEEDNFVLSEGQELALEQLRKSFGQKDVVLLHGVTASGKTQLYIRLIQEQLAKGNTVLYLLPEIALTAQIVQRLRKYFGHQVGVYHSRFNDNERAEVWQKVLNGEYSVILAARSGVFLPFRDLGLIIVDEEHENSYKQFDPAPRYHARDTAVYLGGLHRAKVLLGSATPAIESYYNAKSGKYGLVVLSERYGKAVLPEIEVVSIGDESKRKLLQGYFTSVLLQEIGQALERKEQVILFQNRRGYTPMLICQTCGYTPKCVNCDVSLTYHKSTGKLHCHYCGFREEPIQVCPACGSTHIENKGFGTERIEEELSMLMPDVRIARLDVDAARGKDSFERILNDFDEQRFQILVGTQMVAKGLDFGKVSVIGIINADSLINYPDFRAFERSFSLLSQVSGRAGRREQPGKVVVQAYAVHHRVLEQVKAHDYEGMFMTEIAERKHYAYPPFYRLIELNVKHKDQQQVFGCAARLASLLQQSIGAKRILGPEVPLVSRIRNYYLSTIIIKIERDGISIAKVKEALKQCLVVFEQDKANKGAYVQVDVDPY